MEIQFESPTQMLNGEKNSKKLNPNSDLVKYLSAMRLHIKELYPNIKGDDRPWHIELNNSKKDKYDAANVIERAKQLEKVVIDPKVFANYCIMNDRAFVLKTPSVSGYGATHVTIAYFEQKIITGDMTYRFLFGLM